MVSKTCGLLLFALAAFGQSLFPGGLTRFAGADTFSSNGDNGPAYYATFNHAEGLARDPAGNLYVSDEGAIRKVDTHGIVISIPTGTPPAPLAIDIKGNLYFIDGLYHILRLAPDGSVTVIAGNGTEKYNGEGVAALSAGMVPAGLVLDSIGQLYFADYVNQRVRLIRADGNVYTLAGLPHPLRLTLDPAGNLFVTDDNGVDRIDPRGNVTRVAGDPKAPVPRDEVPALQSLVFGGEIALDAAGDIFIASGNIRKITPDGIIHQFVGYEPGDRAPFVCGDPKTATIDARAMIADPAGNLYILDGLGAPRLEQITPAGKLTTIAGDGPNRFSGDGGLAALATFAGPTGIAFDSNGRLYVADTGNNRIRAIDPSGAIHTVAGDGGPTYDQDVICSPGDDRFLLSPRGVWVDAFGNLFIADTGKNRIRKVATDGTASTVIDSLNQPVAVAVDAGGNLFIGDQGSQRLLRLDPVGNLTTMADLIVNGSMTFNSHGDLLIPTLNEVYRLTSAGQLLPAAGTKNPDSNNFSTAELNNAYAVAVDGSGSVYVADQGRPMIQRTSAPCTIVSDKNSELRGPAGLAIDSSGALYIADRFAGTIWRAVPAPPNPQDAVTPFLSLARPAQSAAPSVVPLPPFPDPFHFFPTPSHEALAPGELIQFNGACIGPPDLVSATPDADGKLPITLAGVSILMSGTPVPLISVQSGTIKGVAPNAIASVDTTFIQLGYGGGGVASSMQVQPANPALFTTNAHTSGAASAVNQDGTINSADHPAPRGSIVSLWGTGVGLTNPVVPDGVPAPADPLPLSALPVTVMLDNVPAEVTFAGAGVGLVGYMQVNVRIPDSARQGVVPIVLKVGGFALQQNQITLYVQ